MPIPMARPELNEKNKKPMEPQVPTAATASLPTKLPTTIESTILYNCWNRFPTSSGREKNKICLAGLPVVMSVTFLSVVFFIVVAISDVILNLSFFLFSSFYPFLFLLYILSVILSGLPIFVGIAYHAVVHGVAYVVAHVVAYVVAYVVAHAVAYVVAHVVAYAITHVVMHAVTTLLPVLYFQFYRTDRIRIFNRFIT